MATPSGCAWKERRYAPSAGMTRIRFQGTLSPARAGPLRNVQYSVFERGDGLVPLEKRAPPRDDFAAQPGVALAVARDVEGDAHVVFRRARHELSKPHRREHRRSLPAAHET